MLPDICKIDVMKDIFQKAEHPDKLEKFIKKLKLSQKDEAFLLNKYCKNVKDKEQIYTLNVSSRQFYKLHNKLLIKAYDAMRRCIRYKN